MIDLAVTVGDGVTQDGWYKDEQGRRLNVKERSPDGSKTHSQLTREHDEWRDQQPQTSRCAQPGCDWVFVGTAGEGRTAFAEHLRTAHPEVKPRSARGRRKAAREETLAEKVRRRDERTLASLKDRPAEGDTPAATTSSGDVHGADGVAAATDSGSRVGGATTIRYSSSGRRLSAWTAEECIAQVRQWAADHDGEPPVLTDWVRLPGYPSSPTYTRLFGGWAAMIEAAGYGRPTKARRRKGSSGSASRAASVVSAPPPDDTQPHAGAAATADGSGASGAATPEADPALAAADAANLARVLRALADAIDSGLFRRANLALIFDGLAFDVRGRERLA